MMAKRCGWRVMAVCAALGGCDDGESESARASYCAQVCEELDRCDSDTDVMGCEENCEAEASRSDVYFEAKASCVMALSCKEFMDELGPQGQDLCDDGCDLEDCINDQLSALEANEEQEQLCEEVSTKLEACNDALDSGDVARRCAKVAVTLSEEYVTVQEECISMSCTEIEQCLDETADRYDSDVKLFDGELQRD